VAQVALVDEWGRPIFNVLIKQEKPVASYLTPLTGLTKEAIDSYGLPLGKKNLNITTLVIELLFYIDDNILIS